MVLIMSREIYKANAYQYNVFKRRMMGQLITRKILVVNLSRLVRRPEEIPIEYRPFCS